MSNNVDVTRYLGNASILKQIHMSNLWCCKNNNFFSLTTSFHAKHEIQSLRYNLQKEEKTNSKYLPWITLNHV